MHSAMEVEAEKGRISKNYSNKGVGAEGCVGKDVLDKNEEGRHVDLQPVRRMSLQYLLHHNVVV